MAVWVVVDSRDLAAPTTLAPERYHPGRTMELSQGSATHLADVAHLVRDSITPAAAAATHKMFKVLDTSDVFEGYVRPRRDCINGDALGSTKRAAQPGDVLVSRLRPYLHQIGIVPPSRGSASAGCRLVCSTEFFVLRSQDANSIAFLVPYLLTPAVQAVFAAAVEGGHHPRFAPDVLLGLPIPTELLQQREHLSAVVESVVSKLQDAESSLAAGVDAVQAIVSAQP